MASPPPPPPPCHCCFCGCPCADPVGIILRYPCRPSVFAPDRPPWMSQLADADFSKACVADRVCSTCGGAAFCEHCCGDHHRGHDTVASGDHAVAAHRRDSFCIGCRVAFCSELCAHHNAVGGGEGEGHEVIPIDDYDCWYCARCTGSERWFLAAFDGVQIFRYRHGNFLVPLHQKRAAVRDAECRSWLFALLAADFDKTCVTDRVCNTCGGAGFCEHCCGEHHRGHDDTATKDKDGSDSEATAPHRRDSFCIGCHVTFCSDLCAHHDAGGGGIESHEIIPIDAYDDWHCARCTGSERWFLAAFGGSPTFEDQHGNLLVPLRRKSTAVPKVEDGQGCPPWLYQLVAANFSKTCARDRVCNTCGGAAFCRHCCGEHHRSHDTAPATDGSAPSEGHRRDSFCTGCCVGFCSELCAHHAGHEVIPIDAYGDRHFVRSTGSEPWFTPAFGGIETFEDKDGNLMVPLQRKLSRFRSRA
uniref:Uncharacterized protein n=1 Tax=Avena sativa TaxID=4498 RepID=A0ACD5TL16_AVESA